MKGCSTRLLFLAALTLISPVVSAFQHDAIDQEVLIAQILHVDSLRRATMHTLVMDAVNLTGEEKEPEGFVTKERFTKHISIKFLPDTTLYHETYLTYFKDGKERSEEDLREAEASQKEEEGRRRNQDISYNILMPFQKTHRALYEISYLGVVENINDHLACHRFAVRAKHPADSLINGDFFFDTESFSLALVEFSPSQMIRKGLFKLSELRMSIAYQPDSAGFWLPQLFSLKGKGKAAFFIGVNFAVRESYSNFRVGAQISDTLFALDSIR